MINILIILILNPKYLVMRGIVGENGAMFFIGEEPRLKFCDGILEVYFKNYDSGYYASNIYEPIIFEWRLKTWLVLLGKTGETKFLTRKLFKFVRD